MFSVGSHFSLTSLAAAPLIAALFFTWQHLKCGLACAQKRSCACCFQRILHSHSNEADIGYLIFNVLVFGVMFSYRSSQAAVAETRWEFAAVPVAERKQA